MTFRPFTLVLVAILVTSLPLDTQALTGDGKVLDLGALAAASDDRDKYESMISRLSLHDLPRNATGGVVKVNLRIEDLDIIDVDERTGEVDMRVITGLYWTLPSANPDGEDMKELPKKDLTSPRMSMVMSPDALWVPDITVYEQTKLAQPLSPSRVHLYTWPSENPVMWLPMQRITVRCNVTKEPASNVLGGSCALIFASWNYNGEDLDLTTDATVIVGEYTNWKDTARYEITSNSTERKVKWYPCCPEPYPEVHVKFTFRQKS